MRLNLTRSLGLIVVSVLAIGLAASGSASDREPCPEPCGSAASFDGWNCFLGEVPEGSSPFVLRNEIFYRPLPEKSNVRCPLGSLEGSLCRVGGIPPAASAFLDKGLIYHTSACEQERPDWTTVETSGGVLEGRAGHRRAQLRWRLHSSDAVDRIEVLYGQAGAREEFLQWLMPGPFRLEVLPWLTRRACTARRYLANPSGEVAPEPEICKNGGSFRLEGNADEAWLRDLRLRLTYRVEVHALNGSERTVLGPIFLTTR